MSEYLKSESMLLCKEPHDFNTLFLEKVQILCPVFFFVMFLSHVAFKKVMLKLKGTVENSVTLVSAIMSRL